MSGIESPRDAFGAPRLSDNAARNIARAAKAIRAARATQIEAQEPQTMVDPFAQEPHSNSSEL